MIQKKWVSRKKTMGGAVSKQKKKGLLTQSNHLLKDSKENKVTPPSNSSPSTPRGHLGQIHSTLESQVMSDKFMEYLQKLDRADMLDEEIEVGRAGELKFVLAVHQLEQGEGDAVGEIIREIGETYFRPDGLDLDNRQLWTKCKEFCKAPEAQELETGMTLLRTAHDKVLDRLEPLHLHFLSQYRPQTSCTHQIISCLL